MHRGNSTISKTNKSAISCNSKLKVVTWVIEGVNQTFTPSNNLKSFYKGINELDHSKSMLNDENTPELYCNYVDINSFNYIKKRKDFSLFHLNIASLSKHKDELETLLTILDYKFDAIELTETKLIKNVTLIYDITT